MVVVGVLSTGDRANLDGLDIELIEGSILDRDTRPQPTPTHARGRPGLPGRPDDAASAVPPRRASHGSDRTKFTPASTTCPLPMLCSHTVEGSVPQAFLAPDAERPTALASG